MILTQEQKSDKREKYKLFLQDVYSNDKGGGPVLVMLCAIALGQGKIINMTKFSRSTLQSEVKNKSRDFDHPNLRLLASGKGLISVQQNGIRVGGDGEQTQVTESGRSKW
ncbi:hypothetical protein N7476_004704 [Penicillium atrosanguineum]|uniref:Uncharacterized protein n=1 Tax=Penicillium atrosanguineum TaxID=1132637 RepID=A0A9W9Q1E3_9EURO|nr:hypothetical protein N7476_004704 [Penicillium atrosanguineum]